MVKKIIFIFFCVITALPMLGVEHGLIVKTPPENIVPGNFYIFYLHGKIVEGRNRRPFNRRFGFYEYDEILRVISGKKKTVVISEQRKVGSGIKGYAKKIGDQVIFLLKNGVSPEKIILVGASKGGIITSFVSAYVKNEKIRYVLLAGCFRGIKNIFKKENLKLYGNFLSIRDSSDRISISCSEFLRDKEVSSISDYREIITDLNIGHGFIYKPRKEWIDPILGFIDKK